MPDITLIMVLMTGLLGGVHCAGMCGGLSSAFIMQLPPDISRFRLIVLLNIGRLASYTLLGLILGSVGQIGVGFDPSGTLAKILFVSSQILLLFMGLYLSGISALLRHVENLGKPIWQRLSPLMGRLLPIRSAKACLAVGALWGWLPCGLVYSMSTYALSSAHAVNGALLMLVFGLGTLPNLLMMGFFAATFTAFIHQRWVRLLAGLTICAWALWQLWFFWIP